MPLRLSPKALLGVIAGFLLVVALILRPGGAIETASTHAARVAGTGTDASPRPGANRQVAPRPWFAADEASRPTERTFVAPLSVPPGDPQPVYLDPPPQGADFPPATH